MELGGPPLQATISNCTMVGNSSARGSAIYASLTDAPNVALKNCILAFNQGPAFDCSGASLSLSCCDVFGNVGGDYTECTAPQNGIRGNISVDPLFCDAAGGQFELRPGSPCLPKNYGTVSSCGLMGAHGRGCTLRASKGAESNPGDALTLIPGKTLLGAVHPNPTTGKIQFSLALGRTSPVRIELIDVGGRAVRKIVDAPLSAGMYDFDERLVGASGTQLPAGIYYLSLNDGEERTVRKLVLIK